MNSDSAMSLGEMLCLNVLDPSQITPERLIAVATGDPSNPRGQFSVDLAEKFINYNVSTRVLTFGDRDWDMACDDCAYGPGHQYTLRPDQFIANGDAYRSWQATNHA